MRRAFLFLTIITFCLAPGCANAQSPTANENTVSAGEPEAVADGKILIVLSPRGDLKHSPEQYSASQLDLAALVRYFCIPNVDS